MALVIFYNRNSTEIKLWSWAMVHLIACDALPSQEGALKCDHFWFIHVVSYRFNPIRNQLETVLNFWLVKVCMKECELIKGGHTFELLPVIGQCFEIKLLVSVKLYALFFPFFFILNKNSIGSLRGRLLGKGIERRDRVYTAPTEMIANSCGRRRPQRPKNANEVYES